MELKLFFDALLNDGVALMSSVGSIVLLCLGLTFFYKKPTPRWIVLATAAICFFFAAARIWTNEHHARLDAENKLSVKEKERPKPELVGEVVQILWVDSKPTTVLFLLVRVKNIGSLASIAESFHLRVDSLGVDLATTVFPKRITLIDKGRLIAVFHRDNDLTTRIMNPVLPGGAPLVGWLYFVIHDDPVKIRAVERRLHFLDILGREYSIPVPNPGPFGLKYHPGEGSDPFKVDKLPYEAKQP
jgi:hypothetical protein